MPQLKEKSNMVPRHSIPLALRTLSLLVLILGIDIAAIVVLDHLTISLLSFVLTLASPASQKVAFLLRCGIAVLVLLLSGWILERRSPAEVGLARRNAMRNILLGLALSGLMMVLVTIIFTLAGWYHIQDVGGMGDGIGALMGGLLLSFAIAVHEEVLFRGILFRLLERGLGSSLALTLSALAFGWLHINNPGASWLSSLAIALEAGISLAAAYMLTRSLWLSIGLHCGWNFFEGTVFGFNVSGNSFPVLLHSDTTGPQLWTGGVFGPEAGLVAILLWSIVSIVMLFTAARQGKIISPAWIRKTTAPWTKSLTSSFSTSSSKNAI
jgi:membrane protease YdiL (CAAX protease family)